MNILEFMSFDPSWFLTIPGLLITGGVVLLLIALIVFVATSKKDKGATVDPTVDGSIPLVSGPDNAMPQDAAMGNPIDMSGMMNQQSVGGVVGSDVLNQPVDLNNGMLNNDMGIAQPNIGMAVGTPAMQPVPMAQPEVPSVPTQDMPVNIAPVAAGLNLDNSTVTSTDAASQISFDAPQDVPISMSVPQDNNQVIDFGNVPQTPVQTVATEPSNRPIYGGANPLENTASIPAVSNHSAYNGEVIVPDSVVEEVKVVDQAPQVSPTIAEPTAVTENVNAVVPNVSEPVAPAPEIVPTIGDVPQAPVAAPAVDISTPTPVAPTPEVVPAVGDVTQVTAAAPAVDIATPAPVAPVAPSNEGIESLF